jgi:pantetheine-phosphate adenylyltransferase
MNKCFFPGSFDPFTLGHKNIIEKLVNLSDEIIIGVGNHHEKNSFIDANNRKNLIEEAVKNIVNNNSSISVVIFSGLVVDAAKSNKCKTIVRGVRDTSDLNYELRMYNTNRRLENDIETIFLSTDNNYNHISSSLVRQICKLGGSLESLVPENINKYLKNHINSVT